jgi:organic hydroperoxide reductase OsmC/OhrA
LSEHRATVRWALAQDPAAFVAGHYDRMHDLVFEGGLVVPGSPSPAVVAAPYSRADAVDPEAAFTAALSACHMLWFLDLAHRAGLAVVSYSDHAVGTLGRIDRGRRAITRVVLRPDVVWATESPPPDDQIRALHDGAHERCFIANSVTTEVVVEPVNSAG